MRWKQALHLAAIPVLFAGCASNSTQQAHTQPADPDVEMVSFGADKMEHLLSIGQAEALRNMLGGARGLFIAPDVHGVAALLGVQNGTGYLMCRHGDQWSDPVFFTVNAVSLGYQAGARDSHAVVLLMTDEAVNSFLKGKMLVGGTGGFALGTLGAGTSASGSIKGGLQLIVVATNEGAYVGSGAASINPAPASDINEKIYGKNADIAAILAAKGGQYPAASHVRARLTEMVHKAWAVPE